jgi:hypothetical protein
MMYAKPYLVRYLKEYLPQHEDKAVQLVLGMQRYGMCIFDEGQGPFKNDTSVFARWGLVPCVLLLGEWEDAIRVGLDMSNTKLVQQVLSRYTGSYDWLDHVLQMQSDDLLSLVHLVLPFTTVTPSHVQTCISRKQWKLARVLVDHCQDTALGMWFHRKVQDPLHV